MEGWRTLKVVREDLRCALKGRFFEDTLMECVQKWVS